MALTGLVMNLRIRTRRIEPWWSLVGAPVIQELVFRFIPYQFVFPYLHEFWLVGIGSSILFAAIHWYFGKWFVLYSFAWGLILWWVIAAYGLAAVAFIHIVLNFLHLRLGIIKFKKVQN